MFDNEKDDPNKMRDEPQRKQAVRVDPDECEAPEDEGADEREGMPDMPPKLAEMFECVVKRAAADSVQDVEGKYRDQFAVVAMGSIVRVRLQQGTQLDPEAIAGRAYDVAEAMLTERAVREAFGNRRNAEVVTAITEGRAAMKRQLNDAEAACGVADDIKRGAAEAQEHAEGVLREQTDDGGNIKFARFNADFLRRVRELVEAETSPGLTAAIIATDLGCSQLEAQQLLDEVRGESREAY